MQISSRFSIAVHMLTAIEYFQAEHKITSEFLAGSVNVNPVIIRKILAQLKTHGLVRVQRGSGGACLAIESDQIDLLSVYRAVAGQEAQELFSFHEHPNPACPIGANIHQVLDRHLIAAQQAMEAQLANVTLADVVADADNILMQKHD
ncbi:MAG: Rrf2 family transcriptional regulator [Erysipelotrichaceae bacterium]